MLFGLEESYRSAGPKSVVRDLSLRTWRVWCVSSGQRGSAQSKRWVFGGQGHNGCEERGWWWIGAVEPSWWVWCIKNKNSLYARSSLKLAEHHDTRNHPELRLSIVIQQTRGGAQACINRTCCNHALSSLCLATPQSIRVHPSLTESSRTRALAETAWQSPMMEEQYRPSWILGTPWHVLRHSDRKLGKQNSSPSILPLLRNLPLGVSCNTFRTSVSFVNLLDHAEFNTNRMLNDYKTLVDWTMTKHRFWKGHESRLTGYVHNCIPSNVEEPLGCSAHILSNGIFISMLWRTKNITVKRNRFLNITPTSSSRTKRITQEIRCSVKADYWRRSKHRPTDGKWTIPDPTFRWQQMNCPYVVLLLPPRHTPLSPISFNIFPRCQLSKAFSLCNTLLGKLSPLHLSND